MRDMFNYMFIKVLLRTMAVLSLPFIVTSCSNDDDDVSLPSEKACKIVSVVFKDSDDPGYKLTDFSYDDSGRVTGYKRQDDDGDTETVSITYGTSIIIVKHTDRYSDSEIKYYLENGLVSSMEREGYTQIFKYDSSNRLVEIIIEDHSTKFYWVNDDIEKWVLDNDYVTTCKYTSKLNTISLFYWSDSDYYPFEEAVYAAGYFGKTTKHLPEFISNTWTSYKFAYSEFNNKEFPSRISIDYQNASYGCKFQYDMTWK